MMSTHVVLILRIENEGGDDGTLKEMATIPYQKNTFVLDVNKEVVKIELYASAGLRWSWK